MEPEIDLPFKEGQLAEARSFEKGYRGAWFKCQIINISRRRGRLGHVLKYLDFPDEKLKWTMIYHVTSNQDGDAKSKHCELILRPPYPRIYNEKKMPHVSEISEVSVIVGDSWRVGDLVDWWTTGCYWSGRITQILGPNKAKIELNPPPLGEGESYTVLCNDLRPSLDWSPELGWTVPTQEGGRRCAHLVFPINQEMQTQSISQPQDRQESSLGQRPADSSTRKTSVVVPDSGQNIAEVKSRTMETQTQTVAEKQNDIQERNAIQGPTDSRTRKTSRVVADSGQSRAEVTSRATEMQTHPPGIPFSKKRKDSTKQEMNSHPTKTSQVGIDSGQNEAEEERNSDSCQEKYRAVLNSKRVDTLEAAIMDLEEYVNKVKWLKKILKHGISSSGDDEKPQWTFMEPHASLGTPK